MSTNRLSYASFCSVIALLLCFFSNPAVSQNWSTVTTSDGSAPTARHESASVEYNGKIYLFGGRGNRPVDVYDPQANTWTNVAQAPLEMHHFQPVVYAGKIYIIGALTCCFPSEPTIADIHVFDPQTNTWSIEGSMPSNRLRGSAGTVIYNDKIYIVGGNTLGHNGGAVSWFDEYDPATGTWRVLPDAPTARDHFAAVVVGNQLIASAGRQSTAPAFLANTVEATEVYNFNSQTWSSASDNIPTPRAGTVATQHNNLVYVLGGESTSVAAAHPTVEVFDPATGLWSKIVDMIRPRHAGGLGLIGDILHVFVGSTTRGAAGESAFHEKINVDQVDLITVPRDTPAFLVADTDGDGLTDFDEINTHMTNPNNSDSDNDDLSDADELTLSLDPNNSDTDADGVTDGQEVNVYQTDPLNADSDTDGIADGIELFTLNSDPDNTDSDGDGLSDGDEHLIHGTNPALADSDSDGLSDIDEIETYSTNPTTADTDNDGVSDGQEIETFASDPLLADSDGDGISDGQELLDGSSLTNLDEDSDGLLNAVDGTDDTDGDGIPNYLDRDSDNDGIPDLIENGFTDVNRDGIIDTKEQIQLAKESQEMVTEIIEPEPTSETIDTDADGTPNHIDLDSDQDGAPDLFESNFSVINESSRIINLTDTDEDGLDDRYLLNEQQFPRDTDSDNTPDYLDLDSDNDAVFDLVEIGLSDENADGQIDSLSDTNNDGLTDTGSELLGGALPDEDQDKIPDVIDSEFTSSGGSGCSIMTNSANDPFFPVTLLLMSSLYAVRRKKRVENTIADRA